MRFFFRSRQFKIIASVAAVIIAVSAVFAVIGIKMAPQADVAGMIAAPFQTLAVKIKNGISDFFSAYNDGNDLLLKNAELESQISELRKQNADYNDLKTQNDFYKNYLGIKEANPDFTFAPATLIARDSDNPYGGFTINKGTLSGIKKYDPVITDAGLVGYIGAVGSATAKVTTILSPDLTLGALDNRTRDSGIVSGTPKLAQDGKCKFYNLSRSCSVAIGDYVVTSGEGIFPDGLLIGTIEAIGSDQYNTSIFADVKPFVDFSAIRSVMVITAFDGQGGVGAAGGSGK